MKWQHKQRNKTSERRNKSANNRLQRPEKTPTAERAALNPRRLVSCLSKQLGRCRLGAWCGPEELQCDRDTCWGGLGWRRPARLATDRLICRPTAACSRYRLKVTLTKSSAAAGMRHSFPELPLRNCAVSQLGVCLACAPCATTPARAKPDGARRLAD